MASMGRCGSAASTFAAFRVAGRSRSLLASRKPVPVPVSIAQGDALDIGGGRFPSSLFGAIAPQCSSDEGAPAGAGPVDVGDGPFTYRRLLALPGGGVAALERIDRVEAALRYRYGRMLLRWRSPGARLVARAVLAPTTNAGRAIRSCADRTPGRRPVPVRVRLGLLHAAVALPGVTVTRAQGGL